MLKTSAKYDFGLPFARFMALNDDLTIPANDMLVGGAGPFDFSGVSNISAVPLKVKLDNAAVQSLTVDLSGAVSQSAVTGAELVSALDTAFTAAVLELDASVDAANDNRVTVATTNTASPPTWIQFYDECAEIAMFGQGFGLKFIKTDTLISITKTPILKDEETFTTTDAEGIDTEIISDGYRKGFTATIVDTAQDWELMSLIEGGTYDETSVEYDTPTSEDSKIYFFIEVYYPYYSQGTNKEADLVGYVKELYRSCKGTVGDRTNERAWMNGNYTVTGTSYKDENGDLNGDTQLTELSKTQYAALNLDDV
jgi:hypothetical protein